MGKLSLIFIFFLIDLNSKQWRRYCFDFVNKIFIIIIQNIIPWEQIHTEDKRIQSNVVDVVE